MRPEEAIPSDERDDDIRALLASLDHPTPTGSAAAVAALAESRSRVRADRRRTALRWAAAVLLSVGAAGAAVAAPGSPVRAWVASLVARLGGERGPAGRPEQVEAAPVPLAGIAVPADAPLALVFASSYPGAVASVSFSDGDQVVVRAQPGVAHFTLEPDRVLVAMQGPDDTVTVEIPRTAPGSSCSPAAPASSWPSGDGPLRRRHRTASGATACRCRWEASGRRSSQLAPSRAPTGRVPAALGAGNRMPHRQESQRMRASPFHSTLAAAAFAAASLGCNPQDSTQPTGAETGLTPPATPARRRPTPRRPDRDCRSSIPTTSCAGWTTRSFPCRQGAAWSITEARTGRRR